MTYNVYDKTHIEEKRISIASRTAEESLRRPPCLWIGACQGRKCDVTWNVGPWEVPYFQATRVPFKSVDAAALGVEAVAVRRSVGSRGGVVAANVPGLGCASVMAR